MVTTAVPELNKNPSRTATMPERMLTLQRRAAVCRYSSDGARVLRRFDRGFTLIELMVVMAIISILLSIALPIYQKSIIRAKESVLRNNLFTLRDMIDEYTIDKQKAPESLDDLVSDGYLRQIPQDPMTGSNQTWKTTMEDTPIGGANSTPGIFDVHSGSDKTGLDGTAYADW